MAIGQELLNVPMGDMIRQMAFAIADGQYALDESSIRTAEMMGGLKTVYDDDGKVAFDDSRVFFGYEYMTLPEAVAYAAVDDALTGTMGDDVIKLSEVLAQVVADLHPGVDLANLSDAQKKISIRVPTRHSMMELGFAPTFYQFVDTIIEVKIAIKITRESSYTHTTKRTFNDTTQKSKGWWLFSTNTGATVSTSQVDATYSSKYSYSAEGASILPTKLVPVPVPAALEQRIQSFMESEEQRRQLELDKLKPGPVA
ncbi:hypothetical protein [Aestuariimicrobium ganziense]|uniref:hypothetical protein n=1 Tax=Aestuariimicrobium ganziense TaxID=2773677 RepID=UPI0019433109|nr:hypothetical protein [Aestuariimicrobium ganziense]